MIDQSARGDFSLFYWLDFVVDGSRISGTFTLWPKGMSINKAASLICA